MGLYRGWEKNGRPFSRAEYEKSFVKKSLKKSYSDYLAVRAREEAGKEKRSRTRRTATTGSRTRRTATSGRDRKSVV